MNDLITGLAAFRAISRTIGSVKAPPTVERPMRMVASTWPITSASPILPSDVRGQFATHEICDADRWLHSVDLLAISSSYHPTASGQKLGYQPVFSRNTG